MNKEEITYKIPNNQIHISEIKDEDCLIWISPKALYMANTIDELQRENKQLKEKLDWDLQWALKYEKQVSNWNKLKEYLNYKSERAVGEDEYVYDEIYNEMQELERDGKNE